MRRVLYILGQLTDEDTEWLARNGEKTRFQAGDLMIRVGVHSDHVIVMLSGTSTVKAPNGQVLAVIQSGDVLGEMSMIDSSPPIASVQADGAIEALLIRKDILRRKLEEDVGFAARFYRAIAMFLSERLRNTIVNFGYGQAGAGDDGAALAEPDEIDSEILDNVHLAGARFERILQILRS